MGDEDWDTGMIATNQLRIDLLEIAAFNGLYSAVIRLGELYTSSELVAFDLNTNFDKWLLAIGY